PTAFAFGAHAVDLTLAPIVRQPQTGATETPVELRFANAVVASPYLKLTRTPEGWSSDAAWQTALGNEAERAPPATPVVGGEVAVRDGRLQVEDETAVPGLALDLSAVSGLLREVRMPTVGVGEFELQGMDPHLGGLRVSGARGGDALRAELSAP